MQIESTLGTERTVNSTVTVLGRKSGSVNFTLPGLSLRFQVAGRVNTTSRQGIKQLGISFGSSFLLLSSESNGGPHS